MPLSMRGGQRTPCRDQFSFHHEGSRDCTQASRLSSKWPYLMNHLTSPTDVFIEWRGSVAEHSTSMPGFWVSQLQHRTWKGEVQH